MPKHVKMLKMHDFSSLGVHISTQQNFARANDCTTVTFRSSGVWQLKYKIFYLVSPGSAKITFEGLSGRQDECQGMSGRCVLWQGKDCGWLVARQLLPAWSWLDTGYRIQLLPAWSGYRIQIQDTGWSWYRIESSRILITAFPPWVQYCPCTDTPINCQGCRIASTEENIAVAYNILHCL